MEGGWAFSFPICFLAFALVNSSRALAEHDGGTGHIDHHFLHAELRWEGEGVSGSLGLLECEAARGCGGAWGETQRGEMYGARTVRAFLNASMMHFSMAKAEERLLFLKPATPDDIHPFTLKSISEIVTSVLFHVFLIDTTPAVLFTRRRSAPAAKGRIALPRPSELLDSRIALLRLAALLESPIALLRLATLIERRVAQPAALPESGRACNAAHGVLGSSRLRKAPAVARLSSDDRI